MVPELGVSQDRLRRVPRRRVASRDTRPARPLARGGDDGEIDEWGNVQVILVLLCYKMWGRHSWRVSTLSCGCGTMPPALGHGQFPFVAKLSYKKQVCLISCALTMKKISLAILM